MYILIGSQNSLYTGKLRAYLRYKGIPFEEIVASQNVYKTVILPRTGVAFIPVLVCPDGSAADSTDSNTSSSSNSSSSTGLSLDVTSRNARPASDTATVVLQDSHATILRLEQAFLAHPVLPSAPQQQLTAMLLELYGDEHLLLPAMHYRWSYPEHATYMHYQFGEWNELHLSLTAGAYSTCKHLLEATASRCAEAAVFQISARR
jgi:hypothetical protein